MSLSQRFTALPVLCAVVLVAAAAAADLTTSGTVRSVDDIPPAPATGIRALNTGGEILVTWTASVDDAQSFTPFGDTFVRTGGLHGYRIYRAIQGVDAELIGTASPGVVEFTDPVAVTGTTYIYSVRPFDADNETLPEIVPGSPEDLARIVALGGGPPDVVIVTRVQAQMSFDIVVDLTNVDDTDAFKASFITTVAAALGIPESWINVIGLTAGSTIVDFEIVEVEGDAGPTTPAEALEELVLIVADDTQDVFASIGPVLELIDESVDEVIVIPLPIDDTGAIVLSWFTRSGTSVGFDDFFLFADFFGLTQDDVGYDATFDIVPNGSVDFDDFFRFADDFGTPIANAAEIQALLGQ